MLECWGRLTATVHAYVRCLVQVDPCELRSLSHADGGCGSGIHEL